MSSSAVEEVCSSEDQTKTEPKADQPSPESSAPKTPRELSQEELDEISESFRTFDKDNSGTISLEELGSLMRFLGQNPSEADLKMMIDSVDDNKNGVIDYNEFLQLMSDYTVSDPDEELRDAFKVFDRNGDGFIQLAELRKVLTELGEKMSEDEINEMMKEADLNNDGRIDYEEFVKYINAK